MLQTRLAGLGAVLKFDNWPMLLMGRLFDRRTGLVVYRKRGMEILVDHGGGDESGTRACITSDMYRKYLQYFRLPERVRVLDLGANGGGFPLMLKLQGMDVAQAVCVEMNPLTYQRLGVNLATNFGPYAVAVNAAVCGPSREAEILLKPRRGGTDYSMFAHRADPFEAHFSVPTMTLHALYERYFAGAMIDICKIDIESAEYEVIASAADWLLQKIRYLLIELHDPARSPEFLRRIAGLGFADLTISDGRTSGENMDVRAYRGPAAEANLVNHVAAD